MSDGTSRDKSIQSVSKERVITFVKTRFQTNGIFHIATYNKLRMGSIVNIEGSQVIN